MESESKRDKERLAKLEKELEAERKEKKRWESKVSDLDSDLTVCLVSENGEFRVKLMSG